jgi:hypothetical protein
MFLNTFVLERVDQYVGTLFWTFLAILVEFLGYLFLIEPGLDALALAAVHISLLRLNLQNVTGQLPF